MQTSVFETAFNALPAVFREARPACAMILGSGWNHALASFTPLAKLPYSEIPGLGATQVAGHSGELVLFGHAGETFLAFSGRRHYYEGLGWEPALLPVEIARRLAIPDLLITNAAGAINPAFRPGDLMIIADHLKLCGVNPLIGPVVEGWGARFPDLSEVYSRALRRRLRDAAGAADVAVREGVYVFTTGPTYETPAEIRAYARMGADAAGMSTVPEAIVARAAGMRVAAVSCITNMAAGILDRPLSHQEVLEETRRAQPRMAAWIRAFCG
ncbi:MAG: purine-nucleoside phosphorylase [Kiritimatiellaeota bacterium]|nr:purine-nucleoside phosphorylase [Kiritimatiellota bacterium]